MRLSDLQDKDIINLVDGKKIGNIIDVFISNDGKIESLLIERKKFFSIFSNNTDSEIKWKQIRKIGEDVILVNLSSKE